MRKLPATHYRDHRMATRTYLNKLKGSRILIFGATSGIGFAVAEASLESGANVIISGSRQAKLDHTITRLLGAPQDASDHNPVVVRSHVCDLSDCSTMERNLAALMEAVTNGKADKLDHIIFTAGDALPLLPMAEITPVYIQLAATVRFIAPMMIAKLLPTYMHNSADSSFTITSGVNGTKPSPGWAIIAGYSAAQEGLAKGLAVDLSPVRVNCVSPGSIKTELFNGLSEEVLESMRQASLTKRLGRPEDVAEAYLYAMRDGFVTGSILHSNGGRLLT